LQSGNTRLSAPAPSLRVSTADWQRHTVILDGAIPPQVKTGQVIFFGEARYAYEIRGIDRAERRISLGDQECIVGRGDIDRGLPQGSAREVSGDTPLVVQTSSFLPHARAGMHLVDEKSRQSWRLQKIDGGKLQLGGGGVCPPDGRSFTIVDYGPGDTVAFSAPALLP
jgi:hypothetical protein